MATQKKIVLSKSDSSLFENRKEARVRVMNNAISSKEAATKFLKNAGILNKSGNLSKHYK